MKKRIIIFIPGFKGSALLQVRDNKRTWLCARELLFGNNSIKLEQLNSEITCKEDGILYSIPIIPKIIEIDFYKSFLENIKKKLGETYEIIGFSYDWRKDIIDSVLNLSKLIDSIKYKYSISIIAHSMGGLITSYYLRYGAQQPETAKENWFGAKIIDKIIFAGVPFQGSATLFFDIQNGSKIALNRKLLDFETMSTFPSAYQLLPSPDIHFLLKKKDDLKISVYEPDNWEINQWGLFKKRNLLPKEIEHYKRFLWKNLNRAIKIKCLINASSRTHVNRPLKILNLIGINQKTIIGMEINDGNNKIIYGDGDGTVTVNSAKLPAQYTNFFNNKEFYLECKHRNLYKCKMSRRAVFDFFMNS